MSKTTLDTLDGANVKPRSKHREPARDGQARTANARDCTPIVAPDDVMTVTRCEPCKDPYVKRANAQGTHRLVERLHRSG